MKCSCDFMLIVASLTLCIVLINGATTITAEATTVPTNNTSAAGPAAVTSPSEGTTSGLTINAQTIQTVPGGTTGQTVTNNPTTNPATKPSGTSPKTTKAPPTTKQPGRKFDGASFGGGFGLAAGLMIIGGIIYCFYSRRNKTGYNQY